MEFTNFESEGIFILKNDSSSVLNPLTKEIILYSSNMGN